MATSIVAILAVGYDRVSELITERRIQVEMARLLQETAIGNAATLARAQAWLAAHPEEVSRGSK